MGNVDYFRLPHYQRHNQRRQEHLATLGLPLASRRVLEVGAGIGDHTGFLIDRQCRVTASDGRADLLETLQTRHPGAATILWDVETPPPPALEPHEVVYAYGLLYHTSDPQAVLHRLAALCTDFLVLETCVSFGDEEAVNLVGEPREDPTQALSGTGCRPTRAWIFAALRKQFAHVYLTRTQPWHEEFPLDWRRPELHPPGTLARSVFVASRRALDERHLSNAILEVQVRC